MGIKKEEENGAQGFSFGSTVYSRSNRKGRARKTEGGKHSSFLAPKANS